MPTIETSAPPDAPEDELEERCDTCERAPDHCHCQQCPSCEEMTRRGLCSNCDECRDCCNCYWCGSCEAHVTDICGDCEHCFDCCTCNEEQESRLIHDYSFTPDEMTFVSVKNGVVRGYSNHKAPDEATYLGLEIETEAVHCSPDEIAEIWTDSPFGYAKHDSSLNDGVECVTHPYTYQALRQNDLGRTLRAMSRAGARSWGTGTCGLHIHISRKAFSKRSHLWRFCSALNSLQRELIQLSGRHSDQWASWNIDDDSRPAATKVVAGKADNGTRYRAINLDNTHTVECRFWRGSLAPETVLGAAAITDGLVEWTRVMPFRQIRQGLTFAQFMEWAAGNLDPVQYGDIVALNQKRNMPRMADRNDLECAS